jgi:hypothetical protein
MRLYTKLCGLLYLRRGARKLAGENLKVIWDKFSTLSYAVLQNVYNS